MVRVTTLEDASVWVLPHPGHVAHAAAAAAGPDVAAAHARLLASYATGGGGGGAVPLEAVKDDGYIVRVGAKSVRACVPACVRSCVRSCVPVVAAGLRPCCRLSVCPALSRLLLMTAGRRRPERVGARDNGCAVCVRRDSCGGLMH